MGFRCFGLIRNQEVVNSAGQMVWELENSWIQPDKWASKWSKPRMIVHTCKISTQGWRQVGWKSP